MDLCEMLDVPVIINPHPRCSEMMPIGRKPHTSRQNDTEAEKLFAYD
ncbi:hypothetical protein ACFPFV_12495 [Salinicoccus siamensis]